VTTGKPTVWSLEQAHYLLTQMRQTTLNGLSIVAPKLDPNAVLGQRYDILKTMLGISGGYDDTTVKSEKESSSSQIKKELISARIMDGTNTGFSTDLILSTEIYKANTWDVQVIRQDRQGLTQVSKVIPNPFLPHINNFEILFYTPKSETQKGSMRILFEGTLLNFVEGNPDIQGGVFKNKEVFEKKYILDVESPSEFLIVSFKFPNGPDIQRIIRPDAPTITKILNSDGPPAGKFPVAIQGMNLRGTNAVFFGTEAVEIITVDDKVIHVLAPAHEEGEVFVKIETQVKLNGNKLTNIQDFEKPDKIKFTYKTPKEKKS